MNKSLYFDQNSICWTIHFQSSKKKKNLFIQSKNRNEKKKNKPDLIRQKIMLIIGYLFVLICIVNWLFCFFFFISKKKKKIVEKKTFFFLLISNNLTPSISVMMIESNPNTFSIIFPKKV